MTTGRAVAAVVVLIVAACGAPPLTASPSAASHTPDPATPSPATTALGSLPAATAPGSPTQSADPTPEPTLSVVPPTATLVAGRITVDGQLGTWIWTVRGQSHGDDAPWLPGAGPVKLAPGTQLTIHLGGMEAAAWSASLRPARNVDRGDTLALAKGRGEIRFKSPRNPGPWSLSVTATFGDQGEATWFWRLESA